MVERQAKQHPSSGEYYSRSLLFIGKTSLE